MRKFYVIGDYNESNDFPTLDAAIAFKKGENPTGYIVGDGYDCDADEDGFFVMDDGLTDEERELVELSDGMSGVPDSYLF